MKGFKYSVLVLVTMVTTATPVAAQSSTVARAIDRIEQAVERMMTRVSGAFNLGESDAVGPMQSAEDYLWRGSISAGQLEIKGVNGSITVERASGSEVVVAAEAHGRRSDPSTVRIEMVEHADGVTFCAVYPTPEGERDNFCGAGSEGRMNTRRNDVQVDFFIQLPEDVEFVGRTVNGDIEALDLDSDVMANTVNGDVDLSTSGFARAQTVNGSIDAEMGRFDLGEGASFTTVNGSITVDLPDDVDADLDASWLNGGFESDLPVLLQGRMGRGSARGALGDGGPELELTTVNGSIRIR